MSVMIIDAGNSLIKAKTARQEFGDLVFHHAVHPLTENVYKQSCPDRVRLLHSQTTLVLSVKGRSLKATRLPCTPEINVAFLQLIEINCLDRC
jgi:hypothetical protein